MSDKARKQLGMNITTARSRLVKDLLYRAVVVEGGAVCHHCRKFMEKDEFTIEHITPWLDSDDPVGLYFELDNVSFSHLSCNSRAARRVKRFATAQERCNHWNRIHRKKNKAKYSIQRQRKYRRTGT